MAAPRPAARGLTAHIAQRFALDNSRTMPGMTEEKLQRCYPHGDLENVFPDVFFLRGSIQMGRGVSVGRAMTIVRQEGDLTLFNAVRLNEPRLAKLDALGKVRHILRTGHHHGSDDAFYADRYGCEIWALPGTKLDRGATISHELSTTGALPLNDAKLFVFEAAMTAGLPEAAVLLPGERLLITTDALQNWEHVENCSFLASILVKVVFMGQAKPGPFWVKAVKRRGGTTLVDDYRRLLELDFDNLLSGHGQPLLGGAREKARASIERTFRA